MRCRPRQFATPESPGACTSGELLIISVKFRQQGALPGRAGRVGLAQQPRSRHYAP
jgi:hypothetical protein